MSHVVTRVTLTWAQTLDGFIAPTVPARLPLSGQEALEFTHQLRAQHRSILIGVGTALSDDPQLTCRFGPKTTQPVRIILDSRLRLQPTARLFEDIEQAELWVLCTSPDPNQERLLGSKGAKVIRLPDLGPATVLGFLSHSAIESVLIEGGSAVLTRFWQERLFDRLVITITPNLIESGLPALKSGKSTTAEDLIPIQGGEWRILGQDVVYDWRKSW